MTGSQIRKALLESVNELADAGGGRQTIAVFTKIKEKLNIPHNDIDIQQALLTMWGDLFRNGYLCWGQNLDNPNPPFFHITEKGRKILRHLSRDPANPDGYIQYLQSVAKLSLTTEAYLLETIQTYNSNCHKAAAVMVGAAAESIILELRDNLVKHLQKIGKTPHKDLNDWRIKRISESLKKIFDSHKTSMPGDLRESYEGNWTAFTQQIRKVRNDAGHPANIKNITEENVHASLLIFPELAKLAMQLNKWIKKLK